MSNEREPEELDWVDSDDYVEIDAEEMRIIAESSQVGKRGRLSKSDADSIVGGEEYIEGNEISDENKVTDQVDLVGQDSYRDEEQEEIADQADEVSSEKTHPSKPLVKSIAKSRSRSKRSSLSSSRSPSQTPTDSAESSTPISDAATQKIFSFSLPFGGLSNIRTNLYKQIKELREDIHIPLINSGNAVENNDPANDNGLSAADEEMAEHVRLQLERQVSLNTVLEANYFKKFKGTDNTRIRAIRQNISNNVSGIVHPTRKKTTTPFENIFQEISGNVIILGGYRGSVLRDTKTDKRVWIPFKAGFHLRKINLLLGPTMDDEINASKLIYPDGMLKNVGPVDISKKLIKKLSSNPNINIKDFGYDWRLSGDVSSAQLEEFMLNMYRSTAGTPIIVIAHSMGGMIAHSVMQRRPEIFRSIIYVGAPSECLNILGPIRFGDSVILSDKILTPEANFMMRSGFNFLPLSGRVFVNQHTEEYYDLDYFNPDTWVEYNLNPIVAKSRKEKEEAATAAAAEIAVLVDADNTLTLVSPSPTKMNKSESSFLLLTDNIPSMNTIGNKLRSCSPIGKRNKTQTSKVLSPVKSNNTTVEDIGDLPADEQTRFAILFSQAYEYLKDTLFRTKEFILGLDYKPELEEKYPPLVMVYGNQVPSVRGSNVNGIQDIKDGNYYNFYYGHGDGVVHQKWLMPQKKGFKFFDSETGEGQIVGKFASARGHVSLMTDIEAMARAFIALVEAEAIWPDRKKKIRNKSS